MKNFLISMLLTLFSCTTVNANAKILFIPHDDRPISYHQTIEVAEQAGCNIIAPPKNLLNPENIDNLWDWIFENISDANSAVISSDSLFYGGLIPSRKHEISQEVLDNRLTNFEKIHRENPNLKIYVFDSLMRTPQQGTKGDIEEPEYYVEHGADIFQYSALSDKKEISKLSHAEENLLVELKNKIPAEIFQDWSDRRKKNLAVTEKLMVFTSEGVIDYLIIGRDDNSPLSQTHKEHRQIIACAEKNNLSGNKFQCMPGIDEFNLLLLTRAVNENLNYTPKVFVKYNKGKGGDTIPAFSDEKISASVDSAITIAGAKKISNPQNADFILLVNTDKDGQTLWGHNPVPDGSEFIPNLTPSQSTKNFADLVESFAKKNLPVGIADINFANGSDNALMKILQEKNLLFKLQSYSGWNTATNSTGFALATGILAKHMSEESKQRLLVRRYLDDWGYQANVRTIVGNEIFRTFGDASLYYDFLDKRDWAEELNTKLLREFAQKNLPHFDYLRDIKVLNTWNRMFECDIEFGD